MKMTNVSSSMSEQILEALLKAQEKEKLEAIKEEERVQYQLNPADVIKEEELEESMGDLSFRKIGLSKLSNANLKGSPVVIPARDEVEDLLKEEGMETQRMRVKAKQEEESN